MKLSVLLLRKQSSLRKSEIKKRVISALMSFSDCFFVKGWVDMSISRYLLHFIWRLIEINDKKNLSYAHTGSQSFIGKYFNVKIYFFFPSKMWKTLKIARQIYTKNEIIRGKEQQKLIITIQEVKKLLLTSCAMNKAV